MPARAAAIEGLQRRLVLAEAAHAGIDRGGRAVAVRQDRPASAVKRAAAGHRLVAEARPADAAHRCARGRTAARERLQLDALSVYGAGAALGGAVAARPSSVIGMFRYSSGAGITCAGSKTVLASPNTHPASIGSNDGAASFSSSLIAKNCAGAKSARTGALGAACRRAPR